MMFSRSVWVDLGRFVSVFRNFLIKATTDRIFNKIDYWVPVELISVV